MTALRDLDPLIERGREGRVVLLTGAGISAESGIPTFRGSGGYWVVGSREYHPQEMATLASYRSMPEEVWRWYLYRLEVCRGAEPNPAHRAIVELEERLGDRLWLITQNVDGLHLRAGSTLERTCQIHGNIELRRCEGACGPALHRMAEDLGPRSRATPLDDDDRRRLLCPGCGSLCRPHVLWFDECYDEQLYRADTALAAAQSCDLLMVIGTSGATSLPSHVASLAARSGAAIIDVNPEANPFSRLAESLPLGAALRGSAGELVPDLVARLSA